MSRSFKNPVPNTNFIRSPVCCCNHGILKKWKVDTQRWKRRLNKKLIHSFLLSEDEKYLNLLIDKLNKTTKGNAWTGPHDGYYDRTFEDYYGYMK